MGVLTLLLDQARAAGLTVRAEGDRLKVRGPRRAEALAQELLARKAEVMALLRDAEGSRQLVRRSAEQRSTEQRPVERKLARLLEGRLWHDRAGWWPKDTGLPRAKAEEMALEAMTREPDGALPEPGAAIAARGLNAIRAWRQIVAFLPHRVGWSVDRSSRVANLIVSTGWHIVEPGERRS